MVVVSLRFAFILSCTLLYGCQHLKEGNTEKQEAFGKKEDAASFNTELGLAYLKQGDIPRAKRKLLSALTFAPDSVEANGAMAYFLEKTSDFTQAKTFYLKALALSPGKGAQLNNYGAFLCRTGHYAEAEQYFLKAVNDVNYVNSAAAYENAGLCAEELPNLPKARAYFSQALANDPQRQQSLYELVSLELRQNNTQQALDELKKYQLLLNNNQLLLELALKTAQKAKNKELASQYQLRLNNLTDYTGVNNEYDSVNG